MATTNFTTGTTIEADWLNDVDAVVYGSGGTVVTEDGTQTLTNKTLTAPTIQGIVGAGTGLTLPAFTGTTINDTAIPTSKTLVVTTDAGSVFQAYDAATLKSNVTATLTKGYAATPYSLTWTGTVTPDEANGNFQYATNNAAVTLNPPTNNSTIVLQVTNGATAGAVTTSGFTKVTGSFSTTNTYKYMCYITKCNSVSHLSIVALQ